MKHWGKYVILMKVFSIMFDHSVTFNDEVNLHVCVFLSLCSVQLQKPRQSDLRAAHSGSHPSQDDEHRAAHSEGGKEYPVGLCLIH